MDTIKKFVMTKYRELMFEKYMMESTNDKLPKSQWYYYKKGKIDGKEYILRELEKVLDNE